jgi:flagellin
MRINTNISALNAWKNLSVTGNYMAKSLEKLSSGFRINKAADDAAGLAISEKMRSQTSGLRQAARNAQDGISMIQTAEGALNETHAILQRMRELLVQANNGTNTAEDVAKIQEEIAQLIEEIDGISIRTEFNGLKLLDGNLGAKVSNPAASLDVFDIVLSGAELGQYTVTTAGTSITLENADGTVAQTINVADTGNVAVGQKFRFDKLGVTLVATASDLTGASGDFEVTGEDVVFQIGANAGAGQNLAVKIGDMGAEALGVNGIVAGGDFGAVLDAIDGAISTVSSERSKLGAWQNRLEHTINNLNAAAENLDAAGSRIRDVDMALEMATFTRYQILQQAGTAMLAQANMSPQTVLKLLG